MIWAQRSERPPTAACSESKKPTLGRAKSCTGSMQNACRDFSNSFICLFPRKQNSTKYHQLKLHGGTPNNSRQISDFFFFFLLLDALQKLFICELASTCTTEENIFYWSCNLVSTGAGIWSFPERNYINKISRLSFFSTPPYKQFVVK